MKLSVSNIGWNITDDEKVLNLLKKYNIKAIDIAPTKYFKNSSITNPKKVLKIKKWWSDKGVKIIGMQALMYGTKGLNLFGNKLIQKKMLNHLEQICEIGSILNANKLVFGSPKNRDKSNINMGVAKHIAIDFFCRLGDIAKSKNVLICLEPNPKLYGANFMTTTSETAEIVKAANHGSIKMQLDTGAILVNKENLNLILKRYSKIIGHIHLSEPNLRKLSKRVNHKKIYKLINLYFPGDFITIETLAERNKDYLMQLEKSLKIASEIYQ
tara:strand:- start:2665 stop:3474 length:810 start_codon:yes stop_codon:yes gene_type:complete